MISEPKNIMVALGTHVDEKPVILVVPESTHADNHIM